MKIGRISRWGATLVVVALLAIPSAAQATDFSFTGNFAQDDDVQLFNFSVGADSNVTLRTYSYAGGTNAAGMTFPAGGFDPILALFDSAGAFIGQNDDGSFPDVGIDPVTNSSFDTFLLISPLAAGDYIVSVMQYDNFATGLILSDGFARQGQGNFTGVDFGPGSGSFFDIDGNQRTNFWAFDVLNVDTATEVSAVPEPATLFLLGSGLVGLGGTAWRRRRK